MAENTGRETDPDLASRIGKTIPAGVISLPVPNPNRKLINDSPKKEISTSFSRSMMPELLNTLRKKVIPIIIKTKFHGFAFNTIFPIFFGFRFPANTAISKLLNTAIRVENSLILTGKKVLIIRSNIGAINKTVKGTTRFLKDTFSA